MTSRPVPRSYAASSSRRLRQALAHAEQVAAARLRLQRPAVHQRVDEIDPQTARPRVFQITRLHCSRIDAGREITQFELQFVVMLAEAQADACIAGTAIGVPDDVGAGLVHRQHQGLAQARLHPGAGQHRRQFVPHGAQLLRLRGKIQVQPVRFLRGAGGITLDQHQGRVVGDSELAQFAHQRTQARLRRQDAQPADRGLDPIHAKCLPGAVAHVGHAVGEQVERGVFERGFLLREIHAAQDAHGRAFGRELLGLALGIHPQQRRKARIGPDRTLAGGVVVPGHQAHEHPRRDRLAQFIVHARDPVRRAQPLLAGPAHQAGATHHQEGRVQALAGDVAERERDAAIGQVEEIVEIPGYLPRRQVDCAQGVAAAAALGQQRTLQPACHAQLALDPVLLHQIAGHARDIERQRGGRGEQAQRVAIGLAEQATALLVDHLDRADHALRRGQRRAQHAAGDEAGARVDLAAEVGVDLGIAHHLARILRHGAPDDALPRRDAQAMDVDRPDAGAALEFGARGIEHEHGRGLGLQIGGDVGHRLAQGATQIHRYCKLLADLGQDRQEIRRQGTARLAVGRRGRPVHTVPGGGTRGRRRRRPQAHASGPENRYRPAMANSTCGGSIASATKMPSASSTVMKGTRSASGSDLKLV
jgi:hypothetical protein